MCKYIHKEDMLMLFFKWYKTLSGEFKLNKKNTLMFRCCLTNKHTFRMGTRKYFQQKYNLSINRWLQYPALLCFDSRGAPVMRMGQFLADALSMLLAADPCCFWGLVKCISRLGHLRSPAQLVIVYTLRNIITFLVEITAKLKGFFHMKLLGRSRFFSGGRKEVESNVDWYKPSH